MTGVGWRVAFYARACDVEGTARNGMKQVIVVRTDAGMSTGKMVAQGAHAAVGAVRNASSDVTEEWLSSGATKVVVKAKGEDDLQDLQRWASREGVPSYLVTDAGRTDVAPGTVTALGLGPAEDAVLDKRTKDLPLM